MSKKTNKNQNDLLREIKEKYPNFLLFPENEFKGINYPLEGKCNTHNTVFTTTYNKILKYNPCKQCVSEKLSNSLSFSKEEIQCKINNIFGEGKYTLLNILKNKKTILELKCNIHNNIFRKIYSDMVNQKQGCPICSKETWKVKRTPNEIYDELVKLNKEYDYSEIKTLDRITTDTKLPIICSKHGVFYQSFHQHIKNGCPVCAGLRTLHSDKIKYIESREYSLIENNEFKSKDAIKLKCNKHNVEFEETYNDFQQGHTGCPVCNGIYNQIPPSLKSFIEELNIETEYGNRSILGGKELDIFFPKHNVAIEYNGYYWHSNEILNKPSYHKNKTDECWKKGIQLIHIWEGDWIDKSEIIKSIIRSKLKLPLYIIQARKCIVREIKNNVELNGFLQTNHLQGHVNSSIKIGLFYDESLISVMTFGKLRKSLGQKHKEGNYELLRFCNKVDHLVIGGASRLFNYFLKTYKPDKVISYANRDISKGDIYEKLGFKNKGITAPGYFYVVNGKKINRFNYRKDKLISMGYNPSLSEKEIIKSIKHIKTIYNSGNIKYEYS